MCVLCVRVYCMCMLHVLFVVCCVWVCFVCVLCACSWVCVCVCFCTYIHTCMHAYIRTYVHTYIHTYVRTYIRLTSTLSLLLSSPLLHNTETPTSYQGNNNSYVPGLQWLRWLQEQLAGTLSQFQIMNSSVRMSPHIVVWQFNFTLQSQNVKSCPYSRLGHKYMLWCLSTTHLLHFLSFILLVHIWWVKLQSSG